MARSSPSPTTNEVDHELDLQNFISELSQDPEKEPVVSEIEVLQSIYGSDAIRLWNPPPTNGKGVPSRNDGTVRYEVLLSLPSPHEDVGLKVLVSLPTTYPKSSPPQLQLLSKYIGSFGADAGLFGSILRTYISVSGVGWSEETVCVFDGLQNALDRCTAWYEDHLSMGKAGALARDDAKDRINAQLHPPDLQGDSEEIRETSKSREGLQITLPAGVQLYVAEPVTDRKSTFIGRACRIYDPSEVPLILSHLMSDRRISRAAHPIINAWRCQVDSTLHQDNDDDGESAAGGRLAHLLQILEVTNVLVVVTRYFGGIHLGPDRFKHINQAARNALEIGGFLDTAEARKNPGRGKKPQ